MKTLVSMLYLTLSIGADAQFHVTGTIRDANANPLSRASILLLKPADSSLVKADVANDTGWFSIKGIERGSYLISISRSGFQKKILPVIIPDADVDLGLIKLEEAVSELAAVQVTATKPMIQVLADKTVFNVESTINAAGSNAWELLRKAPGIIIDNTGNIIVEGKAGVQIFFDGKATQLRGDELQAYLAALQSADIASIEIITQPSSRFDAAGNAGIINIRFKKNKSFGTNGSLSTGFTYGRFARYNNSVTLNNQTKKGNFFSTYTNSFGKSYGFLYFDRLQNNIRFDAKTETDYEYLNHNLRSGYDLFMSKKSTIGIIFNGTLSDNTFYSYSRTPIQSVNSSSFDSVLVANNESDAGTLNYNINLNYRFVDTNGTSLNIDADYGKYNQDRTAYQPNFYYNSDESKITSKNITQQTTPIDIIIATLKADYERRFLKGILALGLKISQVNTANAFGFFDQVNGQFIQNETLSNQFDYNENINALYVNFNRKWSKWNVQAGLRAENTNSDGNLTSTQTNVRNRVKRNYTNYFPSGGLTYQLNPKNQLGLTYSKRVERPNYSSLNPFEYKLDEISFRRGNPFLQPQYTHNLKLAHTWNYRLNSSITYTYIRDFFAQITEAEGESKNFISQRNIANQSIVNLGVAYPFSIAKWWSSYISVNAYRSSYKATDPDYIPITQSTLSLYAQHTLTLPGQLTFEISGWYSSPSVWGGTYRTNALGALNLGLQRKFWSNRLNARLAMNDVFFTSPWKGTTQFGNLFIIGRGGNDSRSVALNLSYNFGSDKIRKSRSRKTGSEEENSRTGG